MGGGFIGLVMLQLLKKMGMTVTVIEPKYKNRLLADKLGAAESVEHFPDYFHTYPYTIQDHFDVIVEAAGIPDNVQQAIHMIKAGGTVLIVGVVKPMGAAYIYPYEFWEKEISVIGSRGNSHDHTHALKIIDSLEIDELITHRYKLSQIEDAFNDMKNDDYIKGVIDEF